MSTPIANTKVWHDGKRWEVSTINRESSAAYAAGMIYAETLVWELDSEGNRGRMVAQGENCKDSVRTHLEMVKQLSETGRLTEDE